jgi:hypothetical protein
LIEYLKSFGVLKIVERDGDTYVECPYPRNANYLLNTPSEEDKKDYKIYSLLGWALHDCVIGISRENYQKVEMCLQYLQERDYLRNTVELQKAIYQIVNYHV